MNHEPLTPLTQNNGAQPSSLPFTKTGNDVDRAATQPAHSLPVAKPIRASTRTLEDQGFTAAVASVRAAIRKWRANASRYNAMAQMVEVQGLNAISSAAATKAAPRDICNEAVVVNVDESSSDGGVCDTAVALATTVKALQPVVVHHGTPSKAAAVSDRASQ
jgi:hypothetical protein